MRFPHALVLLKAGAYQRDLVSGKVSTDDYGYPEEVDQTPTPFHGWLQPSPLPKRVRDVATAEAQASDESGEAFTSHLLFTPMGVPALKNDRVRFDPPDGAIYVVAQDPQDAAGRGHHLEIDLVAFRYGTAAP